MSSSVAVASDATVLDALLEALSEKAEYNRNQQEPPAAILWTDEKEEWTAASEAVRGLLPRFYTLGPYEPDQNRGPAIWLRCALAGKLEDATEEIPVVYLPGVSRRDFRNTVALPEDIKPLAELQFRGVFFSQENGKDWTVSAFLQSSRGGLGLEVAGDQESREAMVTALPELLETEIQALEDRLLDADDFRKLLTPEMTRDLLRWLNQQEEVESSWRKERWEAFADRCNDEFEFDPEKDGVLVAAEKLAGGEGKWAEVWDRFAEAPRQYQSIPELLKKAAPEEMSLFEGGESWPHINEEREDRLRYSLAGLEGATRKEAADTVRELEAEHRERRNWVWSRLGEAPLAEALPWLEKLAEIAESVPHLRSLSELEDYYAETGWRADRSVLELIERLESRADLEAVSKVIATLYDPWLDDLAQRFQALVKEEGYRKEGNGPGVEEGTCLLFADGLRLDVGRRLMQELHDHGQTAELDLSWAALPTVTPTAKPYNSPVRSRLSGGKAEDFAPLDPESGKSVKTRRFRKLLEDMGFQRVDPFGDHEASGKGWAEAGRIDKRGHDEGWRLAKRIPEEIRGLREAVGALLERGWQRVRVITDHGWLLTPGQLEKRELPHFLAETRWSRCALLKEGADYSGPLQPWHWDEDVLVAFPAGSRVFYGGIKYAHGGLSPQECLVPEITVVGSGTSVDVQIDAVEWQHLRCRVRASGPSGTVRVDLRQRAADPESSIADGGKILEEGKVALFVANDDLMDTEAELVLVDEDGKVLTRQRTRVGGER